MITEMVDGKPTKWEFASAIQWIEDVDEAKKALQDIENKYKSS